MGRPKGTVHPISESRPNHTPQPSAQRGSGQITSTLALLVPVFPLSWLLLLRTTPPRRCEPAVALLPVCRGRGAILTPHPWRLQGGAPTLTTQFGARHAQIDPQRGRARPPAKALGSSVIILCTPRRRLLLQIRNRRAKAISKFCSTSPPAAPPPLRPARLQSNPAPGLDRIIESIDHTSIKCCGWGGCCGRLLGCCV